MEEWLVCYTYIITFVFGREPLTQVLFIVQVRSVGPQFVFTISGVDSLESKLEEVQNEMGIDPANRIPITYMHENPDTL